VAFFAPPIISLLLGWPEALGQLVGLILGGIVSLLCAWLPLQLMRDRVNLIGEA
jgi:hypothetical protein